jgi:murein DD-endopeptidase MepM/ murein hydrolase activator NlpD
MLNWKLSLGLILALFVAALSHPVAAKKRKSGWDRYLKRAETLKKYRESGDLDEKALLNILRTEGILTTKKKPSERHGHGSFASGFRPFQVRVYKGIWRWPLRYGIVSSEYGRRWGKRHKGIDIAADSGDKVYAVAPGEVLYASSSLKGYGNVVILRHDEKTTSLYAHNSRILVKKGQRVRMGKVIAKVGSSGRSTGPHVHFEVRRGGKALDPRKMLPKSKF